MERLLEGVNHALVEFPGHIELMKLKGCALGELGEPLKSATAVFTRFGKRPKSQ